MQPPLLAFARSALAVPGTPLVVGVAAQKQLPRKLGRRVISWRFGGEWHFAKNILLAQPAAERFYVCRYPLNGDARSCQSAA
jgi:hypothetical protein